MGREEKKRKEGRAVGGGDFDSFPLGQSFSSVNVREGSGSFTFLCTKKGGLADWGFFFHFFRAILPFFPPLFLLFFFPLNMFLFVLFIPFFFFFVSLNLEMITNI